MTVVWIVVVVYYLFFGALSLSCLLMEEGMKDLEENTLKIE